MSTHVISVLQFEEINNTPPLLLLIEILHMSTQWGPSLGEKIPLLRKFSQKSTQRLFYHLCLCLWWILFGT